MTKNYYLANNFSILKSRDSDATNAGIRNRGIAMLNVARRFAYNLQQLTAALA